MIIPLRVGLIFVVLDFIRVRDVRIRIDCGRRVVEVMIQLWSLIMICGVLLAIWGWLGIGIVFPTFHDGFVFSGEEIDTTNLGAWQRVIWAVGIPEVDGEDGKVLGRRDFVFISQGTLVGVPRGIWGSVWASFNSSTETMYFYFSSVFVFRLHAINFVLENVRLEREIIY